MRRNSYLGGFYHLQGFNMWTFCSYSRPEANTMASHCPPNHQPLASATYSISRRAPTTTPMYHPPSKRTIITMNKMKTLKSIPKSLLPAQEQHRSLWPVILFEWCNGGLDTNTAPSMLKKKRDVTNAECDESQESNTPSQQNRTDSPILHVIIPTKAMALATLHAE